MSEVDKSLCNVLYVLVVGLLLLAAFVAFGHVEQNTSFGLPNIFPRASVVVIRYYRHTLTR